MSNNPSGLTQHHPLQESIDDIEGNFNLLEVTTTSDGHQGPTLHGSGSNLPSFSSLLENRQHFFPLRALPRDPLLTIPTGPAVTPSGNANVTSTDVDPPTSVSVPTETPYVRRTRENLSALTQGIQAAARQQTIDRSVIRNLSDQFQQTVKEVPAVEHYVGTDDGDKKTRVFSPKFNGDIMQPFHFWYTRWVMWANRMRIHKFRVVTSLLNSIEEECFNKAFGATFTAYSRLTCEDIYNRMVMYYDSEENIAYRSKAISSLKQGNLPLSQFVMLFSHLADEQNWSQIKQCSHFIDMINSEDI